MTADLSLRINNSPPRRKRTPSVSSIDMAMARAKRIALIDRPPAPEIGRGVHCRHGRLIGYGRKVELVKHSTCDMSCCPCPCHHGGTP